MKIAISRAGKGFKLTSPRFAYVKFKSYLIYYKVNCDTHSRAKDSARLRMSRRSMRSM